MAGKVIQIFLPDGDPKGVREAQITTDKPEVLVIPKNILKDYKSTLDFIGAYVLVDSLTETKPEIYIGKGKIRDRLYQHASLKDFWNLAFVVKLNHENGFNEAQVSFLEYHLIDTARKLGLAILNENKQNPVPTKLSKSDICELESYSETIKLLFSTLGLKVFQPMADKDKEKIFYCKDRYGSSAKGEYIEGGFLVFKGSKCKIEMHKGSRRLPVRDDLLKSKILIEKNGAYEFQSDYLFSSVSMAAQVVLGRNSNGWAEWTNKDGKTLNDVYRSQG